MEKYKIWDYIPLVGTYRGIREAYRLRKAGLEVKGMDLFSLCGSGIIKDLTLGVGIMALATRQPYLAPVQFLFTSMNTSTFFKRRNDNRKEIERLRLDDILCKLPNPQ